MQPTFGVSFGLPQPSHGYPINPYGHSPIHNPYGPAINSGGINLGLLSVNPLLAIEVTKNDYGEKIVKPLVNLHITPNEHVVNRIGDLFHEKKHYLLNKHEHYHHHQPYHNSYGYYHHSQPPLVPTNHGPPIYSPHYTHYQNKYPGYFKSRPQLYESTASNEDDDYYSDDTDEHYNNEYDIHNPVHNNYGFERSLNVSTNDNGQKYANRYAYSRSLTVPQKPNGANPTGQTFRFPENRKKREINQSENFDQSSQRIQEVNLVCDWCVESPTQKWSQRFLLLLSASRICKPSISATMPTKSGVLPSTIKTSSK